MVQRSVVHGCVENQPLLERALGEYEIQTVMHLAAQTIVGIANRSPLSTFETNIKGTWLARLTNNAHIYRGPVKWLSGDAGEYWKASTEFATPRERFW